jgi:hypothetical protein
MCIEIGDYIVLHQNWRNISSKLVVMIVFNICLFGTQLCSNGGIISELSKYAKLQSNMPLKYCLVETSQISGDFVYVSIYMQSNYD